MTNDAHKNTTYFKLSWIMRLKILFVALIIIIEYAMFVCARKINDDFNKK